MAEDKSLMTRGAFINTLGMSTQALTTMTAGSSVENVWEVDYITSSEVQVGLNVDRAFLGVKRSAHTVHQKLTVKITKI